SPYVVSMPTAIVSTDPRLSDARYPVAHHATHEAGGADALNWEAVHGSGVTAARPGAGPANRGYLYFAEDTGVLWRSNGSTWSAVVTPNNAAADDGYLADAGEYTLDRRYVSYTEELAAGVAHFDFFRARRSSTITAVEIMADGINMARSGTTLAKVGFYSVDGDGSLTQL